MMKLIAIWKNFIITIHTKLRLARALIFCIAIYASETWTLKKADKNKLDAFEMWVYRRMLRISWIDHRTNSKGYIA
ncbi:unnamed protein product [Diabrotica balteata]|uniref:Uncharacterized protein n=1 Tax=Diabrotica balteata TaxID=107213 RepID=A0A9N9SX45_DIABA|nr:unnamed protein product [Diabrotica balteata]